MVFSEFNIINLKKDFFFSNYSFTPLLVPFYIGPYILRYMSIYSPLYVRIYIDTDYYRTIYGYLMDRIPIRGKGE